MSINLLQQRRMMMAATTEPAPALPYDAEVEYLGLDGNQYLDSGLKATQNSKLRLYFSYSDTSGFPLFGSSAYSGDRVTSQCKGASAVHHRFGQRDATRNVTASDQKKFVQLDSSNANINGSLYSWGGTANDFTSLSTIAIGWDKYASAKFKGKIYGFVFYENEELVRDMIPVRVGQVGYLYDKVSGELFGNLGTGDFTLGPDVTE